jgi:hypothetical protein
LKEYKDDYKDRQVRPICYKRFEINTAEIMDKTVDSDPEKTPSDRQHNGNNIRED